MGTLFLVATPIGNLEDISVRALRTLREVELIAAEDTRLTRKLLAHYDIHTPLVSYFEHNKLSRLEHILGRLSTGDVALVSDAGTPALNDPGYELVKAAVQAGHRVSPIPGPASPVAALVSSGLPTDAFLYLGYLPRKKSERQAALKQVADLRYTLVYLETPHRLSEALSDMHEVLGDRQASLARELTKLHEEIWRGTLSEARKHFKEPRGEFVLVVSGKESEQLQRWTPEHLRNVVRKRLAGGKTLTEVAAQLSGESGWARRDIYKLGAAQEVQR
jgi:16S rRNA (cytidine1402-2'-O)-methyltransferase